MSGTFDNQSISIPCPKCGHKTDKTVGWLKTNSQFACRCGERVNVDASQFRREIAKADRALDDFRRQLGRLGR